MNVAAVSAGCAALLAGAGAYLLYSSVTGAAGPGGRRRSGGSRPSVAGRSRLWLAQAGLGDVGLRQFGTAVAGLGVAGGLGGYLMFGALVPTLMAGLLVAGLPVSAYRRRRQVRLDAAADAWPRVLEELRLRTGALGRSIPQALFEAARRAPEDWKAPLVAAEREWLLTTDFARTVSLLKDRLADPTADIVCETLLLAHEIGGTDIDAKLADLIEDRTLDLQARKDSLSRQAGVRFARRFVLLVPLGMALAGLSIGTGRQAYASTGGQIAVAVGLVAVAACWAWSGRLMRLPRAPRVFR